VLAGSCIRGRTIHGRCGPGLSGLMLSHE
jgi:hypothetical protein